MQYFVIQFPTAKTLARTINLVFSFWYAKQKRGSWQMHWTRRKKCLSCLI